MRKKVKFSVTVLLWLIFSVAVGVVGAGVGPGIIMIFYALIVGVCGGVLTCLEQVSIIKLPVRYFGFATAALGVLVGMILMHSALENALLAFLLLFGYFILPSYLIHFMVRAMNKKLFTEHAT